MYAFTMSEMRPEQPPQTPIDDPATLLARIAKDRDKAALAALFHQFAPKIKATMLKRGASNAVAEDLVQETMLTIWRKAALYSREKGAPSTWIFTIARNRRIDQLRRQSNQPYEALDRVELASEQPLGSFIIEQTQVISRVTKALDALPQEQQDVVRLSFIHDLAHAEIADKIGIPLGTVKSRLRLAYDRLRPLLKDLQ